MCVDREGDIVIIFLLVKFEPVLTIYPKMITDLEHKANQLEERIYELGRKIGENSDTNAIADGIADFKAYLSSSPKIAWVLKEPYDDIMESKPSGGGWSIPKDCFMKGGPWGVLTWQRVIYVMYGLKHKLTYQQMDYIRDNPEMGNVLREVAWINLNKMPSYTISNNNQIKEAYNNNWKEIVLKQIELYSPDVIVFCNTLQCCREDFLSKQDEPIKKYIQDGKCLLSAFRKDGRLLLDAYHPGFRYIRGIKDSVSEYVNSLIGAIQEFGMKQL